MTTAQTLTLTDFLLQRIAEDEADAGRETWGQPIPGDCWGPDRVLAECEAKRRIVELHANWPVLAETPPTFDRIDSGDLSSVAFRASQQIAWLTEQEYRTRFGTEPPTSPIIAALAAVYVDHPDYPMDDENPAQPSEED